MVLNQKLDPKQQLNTKCLPLWKPRGLTPLEALDSLRLLRPEYDETKLGYAGRLDPLAEGVMLVLVGEENKNRQNYFGLDKEYEFDVLFGFRTESHDVMGKLLSDVPVFDINPVVKLGQRLQEYPKHSSKRIAKNYAEVTPKEIEIYSFGKVSHWEKSANQVLIEIGEKMGVVTGDFGQQLFLIAWRKILEPLDNQLLKFATFRTHVSSGTYVRLLAHEMGGLAWRITRTRVGDYRKENCLEV